MPFEYYRSLVGFNVGGNYAAVVQHWGIDTPSGTGPFSRAKAFVAAFTDEAPGPSYATLLANILSQDSYLSSVRCSKVAPGDGNTFGKVFAPTEWEGNILEDSDAAQVAACVIWLTSANAGLTGRTFYPGVGELQLEDGRFISTYVTALSELVNGLLNGIVSSVGTFFPHIKHGLVSVYTPIAHGRLSTTPGTQRKRLRPV